MPHPQRCSDAAGPHTESRGGGEQSDSPGKVSKHIFPYLLVVHLAINGSPQSMSAILLV